MRNPPIDICAHIPGTHKGEEWTLKGKREPGRDSPGVERTERDSTGVNPRGRRPIDPRMPHLPPA
jgi:hypothetical protein